VPSAIGLGGGKHTEHGTGKDELVACLLVADEEGLVADTSDEEEKEEDGRGGHIGNGMRRIA